MPFMILAKEAYYTMHLLEKYANNFNTSDPTALASTFDADCIFSDMAPTVSGMDPMWVYGCESVEMVFKMYFSAMEMSIEVIRIEGDTMDYDVKYPGFTMPCRGTLIEERAGKIKRYNVQVRDY